MDYNSLKYIITVDKHQSISKAAEELFLTQPNISKAIQNIEKELDIQIFIRTSRGVTTTQEGKEFIKKAIKIVKSFEDFSKEFSSNNKQIFSLNIAHPKDIYFQTKVIDLSKEFSNEQELNINVFEGTTEEIIEMVTKDNINLGLICVNEHDLPYYKKLLLLNNLEFKCKHSFRLSATFHESNSILQEKNIDKNMISKQTLITTNTNDYYRYYNERYHLTLSTNIIKTNVGLNQVAMLCEVPNSYLLSLPIPQKYLEKFNCKSIELDYGTGEWVTLAIYKKETSFTDLEKNFLNE